MNARIRELIEQATTEEHDGFRYFDKKKFAELIVQETLNVALYGDEFVQARTNVKTLFGVEND